MRFAPPPLAVILFALLAFGYYTVEPWAATFVDDGPYFSTEYLGEIDKLPVQSAVELRRFGRTAYRLESRLRSDIEGSALVLRNPGGEVVWARLPIKPNGELGSLELRHVRRTWYGGWRIAISPSNQEGGWLYLGMFGGYRFLNHSW